MYSPRSRRVDTCWKLPTQAMTKDEKIAQRAARKLSLDDIIKDLEIDKAKQRLRLIEAKAKVDGVVLPNVDSKESRVKQKKRIKHPEPPPVGWEQSPTHSQIETGIILKYSDRHIRTLVKEGNLQTTAKGRITTESILAFLANKEDS